MKSSRETVLSLFHPKRPIGASGESGTHAFVSGRPLHGTWILRCW